MSSNPKNNLLTIHMRKTKKRVTVATKLQALARGKHNIRSQHKRQNNAVTKLQALARGKRGRRTARKNKTKLRMPKMLQIETGCEQCFIWETGIYFSL